VVAIQGFEPRTCGLSIRYGLGILKKRKHGTDPCWGRLKPATDMALWYHQAVPGRDRIGIADQHSEIVFFHDSGEWQGAEEAGHQGKNKGLISSGFERATLVENMRPRLLTARFQEVRIRLAFRVWADAQHQPASSGQGG